MEYKRLEIYTWWKCNHKCVFCIEYPVMEKNWNVNVPKNEIIKKLIRHRLKWYNHVTFLWWEPFLHQVFGFSIRFAKKIWYTVMVATNGSIIQFERKSKEHLWYIDQLILSIPIINEHKQLEINRTKWIIKFDNVFKNIRKYWSWNYLKINTVVNKLNLEHIEMIIEYIWNKWVKEMSITYPDIVMKKYYSKEFILKNIAPSYKEVSWYINKWFKIALRYSINLIITDVPFCCLPDLENIEFTDDYLYQNRLKINHEWIEQDRETVLPRKRKQIDECNDCMYKKICWWPSIYYKDLYWYNEIKAIY